MLIDKHLVSIFIKGNSCNICILSITLSFSVYLLHAFTTSIKDKNISIKVTVYHDNILFTNVHHKTLTNKFICRFQRNIFNIHKILKNQFFFRVTCCNINHDKIIC